MIKSRLFAFPKEDKFVKKLTGILLALLLFSAHCFAVGAGIGVRSIAMGGTGIATANDVISSAYFNPACLMSGAENVDLQLTAGGATQGISEITDILADSSNADNLITNLFPKELNVNSSLSGGLGFSCKKVALSLLATGFTDFSKKADQFDMNINGRINGSIPLTLGSTFSTPGLPIATMSVGVNLKSIYDIGMLTTLSSSGGTATGQTSYSMGTGFGFDIGVQTKITPLITIGGVIRNLSASEDITIKTRTLTSTLDAFGNPQVTEGPEIEDKASYTPAPEVGVGVGVLIPITGTLIAWDLENYSAPDNGNINMSNSFTDTHIGIEQGMFFNAVMFRLGYFTYGAAEDSFYTWGFGFNAGSATMGLAAANSVKDSNNSIASVQVGAAF